MQDIYRDTMLPGLPGMPADSGVKDIVTLINDDPRTQQVDTIVVDTATNSHTYTLKVNGITISYTADATATKAEISAGLKAALDAEPLVSGLFDVADDGVDTITITARVGGTGWTISDVDAKCTLTNTTANDEADPIGFGLLVLHDDANDKNGVIAKSAHLTAHAIVLTPTAVNDYVYRIQIEFNGVKYVSEITADGTATVKEIVEALAADVNTIMPASSVIASEDDTTLTLTSEVPGLEMVVTILCDNIAYTSDNKGKFTDVNRAAAGVTVHTYAVEPNSSGEYEYPANSAMSVQRRGRIKVTTEDEITETSEVYVRLSGTGTEGAFRGSTNAGAVKLDPSRAKWVKTLSATMAVLECNFD